MIDRLQFLQLSCNPPSRNRNPREWNEMEIIPIYKNKGNIMKMDYGMRIFKTNVVSKVYEKKIRLEKAKKNLRKSVNSFQCGGIAGMSTANHLLTLNASGHRLK